jgi:hypothetical protein
MIVEVTVIEKPYVVRRCSGVLMIPSREKRRTS